MRGSWPAKKSKDKRGAGNEMRRWWWYAKIQSLLACSSRAPTKSVSPSFFLVLICNIAQAVARGRLLELRRKVEVLRSILLGRLESGMSGGRTGRFGPERRWGEGKDKRRRGRKCGVERDV